MLTTDSHVIELIEHAQREKKIQFMELPEDKDFPYAVVIVGTGSQGKVMKETFQKVIREMNARGAGIIITGFDGLM
jgi:hypothetical protein